MTAALAVIFAGVLHATWNAIAKGATDRRASFALIALAQGTLMLPVLAFAKAPDPAAWPWLAGSILVHLVYMALLLKSYDLGDFSQVYPLARGSAPLIVALVAALALGEHLSWAQFTGVAAVCGGLVALAFAGGGLRAASDDRAVVAALLTGLSIATYTLMDGIGVRESGGAAGYSAWLFALEGPLTIAWIWLLVGRRSPFTGIARREWALGLTGGVISMAGYGIVLWAQTRGALASVAALRETGVISGAIIGAVVFSERMGARRIVAACVVAAGVVLITAH
ncbi:EamA family transporter [Actinomadura barringtoniae]|uniref:EamA family transporter n=1 Tax=Actinomadura barringtoniae TaxID=1427535 RepID=A0A939PBJ0_9ACTN|nr:DMT family transporter [Actinomadura barringtoniae]MBO2449595.1 EamA family transporter [Actinomadura barringtoniae]